MKILFIILILVTALVFSSCANKKETMVETTTDQGAWRTHTQEELRKTGRTEVGPALEGVDPAVSSQRR